MDDKRVEIAMTKDELMRENNSAKALFMPRVGSVMRTPSGVIYKVVFVNVGQLRFTAVLEGAMDPEAVVAGPSGGMADVTGDEEVSTNG